MSLNGIESAESQTDLTQWYLYLKNTHALVSVIVTRDDKSNR